MPANSPVSYSIPQKQLVDFWFYYTVFEKIPESAIPVEVAFLLRKVKTSIDVGQLLENSSRLLK